MEKRLDENDKVNFKICDVTTSLTNMAIHILTNISKYQAMKLGHLEIFFLKNHTQNLVEKLDPDPFLKSQN